MNYEPIRKRSYVYVRQGKFKTSYLIKYRRKGICIREPLLINRQDYAILTEGKFKDLLETKAKEKINKRLFQIEEKDEVRNQINQGSSLVKFESVIQGLIETKTTKSTKATVKWYLEKKVLPLLIKKNRVYVADFQPIDLEDFPSWYAEAYPGERIFNSRKYFLEVLKRAARLKLLNPEIKEIKIKNTDPKRKAGKVFTDCEVKSLLSHAQPLLQLQILMAFSMGMRKSEILKLQWSRIQWHLQRINLEAADTKIRVGRDFKVNDVVWGLLVERYNNKPTDSPYVFPSTVNNRIDPEKPTRDNKTAWQACKRRAEVVGRFHDLRHTYLDTEVTKNKHQALDVCFYAGLSIEELKKTYLHPTADDTAYLADKQTKKLAAMIAVKQNLDKKLDKEFVMVRYV